MIFDPVRRRKISDYGGLERIFLIHSAYGENVKKAREVIRESARKMGLAEEDVNFWVAPLVKGFLFPRHILIDLHEGMMAVAEFFMSGTESGEEGAVISLDAVEAYPYVCLLPDYLTALKGQPTVYLDFSPQRLGFGVVSFVGPSGVYSVSLASAEMAGNLASVVERNLFPVSLRGARLVKIESEKSYDFVPRPFVAYSELKKELAVSRFVAGLSLFFLGASAYLFSSALSLIQTKADLEKEIAKVTSSIKVLEKRVALLPPLAKDARLKKTLVSALSQEDMLKNLPPYVRLLTKPPAEVRLFLKKHRGTNYVLVSVPSYSAWLAIKKAFPSAKLLPQDTVMIPLP